MKKANKKPVESTADFRARLATIAPKATRSAEDRPCVRQPTDRGYYPPKRRREVVIHWTMPIWAAETIRASLQLDATSCASTPDLRAEVRRALEAITESEAQ